MVIQRPGERVGGLLDVTVHKLFVELGAGEVVDEALGAGGARGGLVLENDVVVPSALHAKVLSFASAARGHGGLEVEERIACCDFVVARELVGCCRGGGPSGGFGGSFRLDLLELTQQRCFLILTLLFTLSSSSSSSSSSSPRCFGRGWRQNLRLRFRCLDPTPARELVHFVYSLLPLRLALRLALRWWEGVGHRAPVWRACDWWRSIRRAATRA